MPFQANDLPNTALYRILTLDGGGAKGFYSIGILEEIEAMTQKPLSNCFDLIFGTSTGAIIAALLARGDSVSQVLDMYKQHVPNIMGQSSARGKSSALTTLAKTVFGDQLCDVLRPTLGW